MNNNATLKITTLIVILLLFFKKDKKESTIIFDEDGEFEFPEVSEPKEYIDNSIDVISEPINVEQIERLTDKNDFIIEDSVKENFNSALGIVTGGLKQSPEKIIKKDFILDEGFINTKSIYEVVNPFLPTIEPIKPNYQVLK